MVGKSAGWSRSVPAPRAKVHHGGCRCAAREAALAAAVAATVVACGHGRTFAWSAPRRHLRASPGAAQHRVSPGGGAWSSPLLAPARRSRVASRSGAGTALSLAKKPSARATSRIRDGWLAPLFLLCAGGNKILLRLLVVPMRDYTYFLSVLINLAYLTFFGARVAAPRRDASKLQASLQFAARGVGLQCLAGAGLCEAFSIVLMPLFAARLPGSLLPVMQQGLLLFSMLSSALLLGRRYDMLQVSGVATVAIGVVVCTRLDFLCGAATATVAVAGPRLLDTLGFLAAYAFIALALTLKEMAFERFARKNKGERLNADVVNFFTAVWQGLALLLFWPLNFRLLTSLTVPTYFHGAAAASLSWAGLLTLVVAVNLAYTAVTTVVLQRLSAVVLLLTNVLNVPLVSLFFCLNIPMLGAERFRWSFLAGLCIIIAGLLIYNHRSWRTTK